MYNVYVLRSYVSGKIYVGFTEKTVEERIKEHNRGTNNWTKGQKPFKLIYYESFVCKEDALRREKFLKTGIGNRVVKAIVNEFSGRSSDG